MVEKMKSRWWLRVETMLPVPKQVLLRELRLACRSDDRSALREKAEYCTRRIWRR
jgi:hypothetical protein